jgi:hypothetical protein
MSKSLLNLLVQISKALVNSKIKFLIQKKSFFFTFGPATLTGPLGLWPSRPRWPSPPAGQSPAHLASQPLGPRVSLAYFAEDIFFFDSCLLFSVPSLYSLADAWAPLVSSIFSTAPAEPSRVTTAPPLPAPPAPHLGMTPSHYRPHHSPP